MYLTNDVLIKLRHKLNYECKGAGRFYESHANRRRALCQGLVRNKTAPENYGILLLRQGLLISLYLLYLYSMMEPSIQAYG